MRPVCDLLNLRKIKGLPEFLGNRAEGIEFFLPLPDMSFFSSLGSRLSFLKKKEFYLLELVVQEVEISVFHLEVMLLKSMKVLEALEGAVLLNNSLMNFYLPGCLRLMNIIS